MTVPEYTRIQEEAQAYLTGTRGASAALLAWFLAAVWRVEEEDIDDAICDGSGDKGIDGLLVDDTLGEITILQSKHRDSADAGQGDADLERLVGAAAYFETPETVDGLLRAKPNPELTRLLTRLEIRDKIAAGMHARKLVFVTDGSLDAAGRSYVTAIAGRFLPLEVWDQPRLAPVAARTSRPELKPGRLILSTAAPASALEVGGIAQLAVGFVPATELVAFPGIDDLSLFDRNVRLSEGRTRINRELGETIDRPAEHALFPAFHNGITMLTHELGVTPGTIELDGFTVVNGCQSVLTLHDHRASLTADLRVLVKVVRVQRHSDLADRITYRSNNQNPVDIRDQRSTDVIQRDLQAEVREKYGETFGYSIRQGEDLGAAEVLDNRTAAQFLMAVYVQEPWNAVRKVRLFDEDYRRVFNRDVDAHRLLFVHEFAEVIEGTKGSVRPQLAASFASIRLTLAHLVAQLLRESDRGRQLLAAPNRWLPELAPAVREAIARLASEVVDSVNFYIDEEEREKGDAFDPKVVFKSQRGVSDMENEVLRFSRRQARRDEQYLFDVAPVR
jgi:hypothetical protein